MVFLIKLTTLLAFLRRMMFAVSRLHFVPRFTLGAFLGINPVLSPRVSFRIWLTKEASLGVGINHRNVVNLRVLALHFNHLVRE